VDPKRSHLTYRECIISGRGERQGAYSIVGVWLFRGSIKGGPGGVGLFSVKGWGEPILKQGRKKTLIVRATLCTLGVQKAQNSLKRAFWVCFERF
jgi:hypothetical protein